MTKETATAVAKKPSGELTVQVDMDELEQMSELVERTNDVQPNDKDTPMLNQVQSLSKCKKNDENAKDGMLRNTSTGMLYDIRKVPLEVIPVDCRTYFVEWTNTNKFVARHDRNSALGKACENNRGSLVLDNGNKIVKTAYWTVLVEGRPAILSMAITKMKISRKWNSMIDEHVYKNKDGLEKTFPRFFFAYNIKAVEEKGDKGDYYNFSIENSRPSTKEEIYKAKSVLEAIDQITWKEEEDSETATVDESVM